MHGIKGELKVHLFFPDLDFSELQAVYIKDKKYEITSFRFHKTHLLLGLKTIPDRTAAEQLRGLKVSAEDELNSEILKIQNLKGLPVFDKCKKQLGTITAIEHAACHEVLVMKTLQGKEILIPYVAKFIKEVNNKLIADLADLEEADEI